MPKYFVDTSLVKKKSLRTQQAVNMAAFVETLIFSHIQQRKYKIHHRSLCRGDVWKTCESQISITYETVSRCHFTCTSVRSLFSSKFVFIKTHARDWFLYSKFLTYTEAKSNSTNFVVSVLQTTIRYFERGRGR